MKHLRLNRFERWTQRQRARLLSLTADEKISIGLFVAMVLIWAFWVSLFS